MTFSAGQRALATFVALLVLGGVGAASATSAPPPSGIMVSNPEPSHGLWSIGVFGTAQADTVEVGFKGGRYAISSPDGVDFYDSAVGCESVSPTEVRCALPSGHRVAVLMNLGNDHLNLGGTVRSESHGKAGADWIDGSPAHNVLVGEAGDDRLAGRGGDDLLRGSDGRDSLSGNAGDDRLLAADGARDRQIDCGPGEDKAIVDRGNIDPDPIDCERVIHHRPYSPA